ncbi:hypothetical protein PVK06_007408 [Gossypium arboreum]|uniref:RNase H type-1 domain-containing protein n=1 Tax=Gossypium arboreum TaxID=29729 RepID=A0ABR0QIM6_GOSAR|nr:hypothetical protein PVK06_007408 [Gossypium arboreum]
MYISASALQESKLSRSELVTVSLEGWVNLYTDGSVKFGEIFVAAGGLLEDRNGKWIEGFTRYLGSCEVIDAELWGILDGIQIALKRGFQKIIIRTDSLEAIKLIQDGVCNGSNSALMRRILLLLKLLSHWNLNYIPREENRIADKIVKSRRDRELGLQLGDKDYVLSLNA